MTIDAVAAGKFIFVAMETDVVILLVQEHRVAEPGASRCPSRGYGKRMAWFLRLGCCPWFRPKGLRWGSEI